MAQELPDPAPRALIFGITGFAGQVLARRLATHGWRVRGFGRSETAAPELEDLGVEVELADVLDPEELADVGADGAHVFYLVGSVTGAPRWIRRVGFEGLVNTHRAVAGAGLASFTFLDTLAVYGRGSPDAITEDTPPRPNSALGRINLQAETYLQDAWARDAFPARIVRAGTIYGPGRGTLRALREGRLRQIGAGTNLTSRIHVDDLAEILAAVAQRGRPGDVYLAVDDDPVPAAVYFDHLADAADVDGPRVTARPLARLLVALFGTSAFLTRGASPLTHSVYALTTASYRCVNAKIRRELGVNLQYPSYRDGVQAMVAADAGETGA